MPRIVGRRRLPADKDLELTARLPAVFRVRNTFHDEDTAFHIIMVVRSVAGDEDGDRLPLGPMESGQDVHMAHLSIEDDGTPRVVSAEHLATCKRDAVYIPFGARG